MHLYLIRHGATLMNAERRYTGQQDVPLNAQGVEQARAVAQRLARLPIGVIVASDLRRARDTTGPLAGALHVEPEIDPDLREVAHGAWEGLTHAEIMARDREAFTRWLADPECVAPGGESAAQVRDRMVRALDRWYDEYPEAHVAWISHSGALMLLTAHLLGMDLSRRWQLRCDPGSISELDIGDEPGTGRYAIVMRWNDTGHLG